MLSCQINYPIKISAKAGIQVFGMVIVSISLDARLRGHDELRHSLLRGRGRWGEGTKVTQDEIH